MHRILSEEKKEKFISSAESIDYTKVSPNDVLKAQDLSDRLKKENIQVEYLYKTGCPYQYIDDSKKIPRIRRSHNYSLRICIYHRWSRIKT